MFLNAIAHANTKLLVVEALLPDPLWVAARVVVAGREWAGAILADIAKRVLGVPYEEAEAIPFFAVPQAVPVVGAKVLPPRTDRRVVIAAVKNHQHVVDQIVNLEQTFVVEVLGTVWVFAKHFEVGLVGLEAFARDIAEPSPCIEVAVVGHHADGHLAIFEVGAPLFDGVVVFLFAAEIGRAVGGLDSFAGIEHPPVVAVDE